MTPTATAAEPFLAPHPPPLPPGTPAWRRLVTARRNTLAMWEEEDFTLGFMSARIIRRRVFICNSPASVQFAFGHANATFERKSPQMRHALEPLLGDGLFISDGDIWRKRRRIVSTILHSSHLPQFAPLMVEAALEVRDRWRAAAGRETDALEDAAHLTAEIICRTLFGRRLGAEHAAEVVDSFSAYQRAVGQLDLVSLLGLPEWMPRLHGRVVKRSIARIHRVLESIIESYRRGDHVGEASVIGRLIDARDEITGAPLDPIALRNEAAVLFMAGHETTANALAWAWFLISQAPAVEARLHCELDAVLAGRPPRLEDVPRLLYTRAVLDETMRLYPPVPVLPREALADTEFEGRKIAKGSIVLVVPWLLHRHRKLWDRPDHFIPERFLEGSRHDISKFAYVPFSVGPRVCAGMSFGIVEAVLCLATLAQEFRLSLRPRHDVRPVARLTLRPDGGLPMTIRPRERAERGATKGGALPSEKPGCPVPHG